MLLTLFSLRREIAEMTVLQMMMMMMMRMMMMMMTMMLLQLLLQCCYCHRPRGVAWL